MADVSLTGILTDLQSPLKQTNNMNSINVFNENSRDSLFFNVNYTF